MKKITVIAIKGVLVPLEDQANQYIDDQSPVEVDKSLYYLRRINDGDLVETKAAVTPKKTAVKKGDESNGKS